jgi:hypothetical protein
VLLVRQVLTFQRKGCLHLEGVRVAGGRCAPRIFLWGGGADPGALYNLCLILKIMLQKSCYKHNITLSATAFIYMRI